jgi:hypothetical protein
MGAGQATQRAQALSISTYVLFNSAALSRSLLADAPHDAQAE